MNLSELLLKLEQEKEVLVQVVNPHIALLLTKGLSLEETVTPQVYWARKVELLQLEGHKVKVPSSPRCRSVWIRH